ncbi:hypothetical protein SAMN05660841_00345 [Sphingobacterium nematocida]|uniref:Uncharacterized protein n=1 Tax=Sphingobacterium nematocida TaxID=1513896 RepID=A0A1T5B0U1_9SPHI|nr:hypothetical protein [Sphingobacterium nematocida]SKB40709.1 hypothetical protein SAMN05660841_00345 [Sphingobacterium nematocida]
MSKRDDMLREILSDPEIMQKYDLRPVDIEKVLCKPPYSKKVIEVMATMIIEMDNNRTPRQIYPIIKNIYKI